MPQWARLRRAGSVILTLVAPALALGAFATFSHFHPRIAFIANTLGFIPLFGTLFAPISYMAIALGKSLPLCDPSLAALDAALGFDWPAMLRWLNGQPLISDAARIAYLSFGAQMTIAGIVCGITR